MTSEALAHLPDLLGYLAAALVFVTFTMRTMLSLRVVAVLSNLAFIGYAVAAGLTPILVLHGALLPLNLLRLGQMQRQVRGLSRAKAEDGFDWLIPLGTPRRLAPGEVLFRKGDPADRMFVVCEGEIELPEFGLTLGPGDALGEISLFADEGGRTATARACGHVRLSMFTAEQVRALHFDNPRFAYRLTRLIATRLVADLDRAERRQRDADRLVAGLPEGEGRGG